MKKYSRPRSSQQKVYKEEITVIVMMMKMEVTMEMNAKETMEMKKWRINHMNSIENGLKISLKALTKTILQN